MTLLDVKELVFSVVEEAAWLGTSKAIIQNKDFFMYYVPVRSEMEKIPSQGPIFIAVESTVSKS